MWLFKYGYSDAPFFGLYGYQKGSFNPWQPSPLYHNIIQKFVAFSVKAFLWEFYIVNAASKYIINHMKMFTKARAHVHKV